jgi:hypothetical protein
VKPLQVLLGAATLNRWNTWIGFGIPGCMFSSFILLILDAYFKQNLNLVFCNRDRRLRNGKKSMKESDGGVEAGPFQLI